VVDPIKTWKGKARARSKSLAVCLWSLAAMSWLLIPGWGRWLFTAVYGLYAFAATVAVAREHYGWAWEDDEER